MTLDRRTFTKAFGAACTVSVLPQLARAVQGETPHFFLFVWYGPGADASYLLDARPLALTRAGKIQNYLGEEPTLYTGSNGQTTLTTRLAEPLRPHLERFTILNGVQMATADDGHAQNLSHILTGNTLLSGPSLLTELRRGDASLDFLQVGRQSDVDRVTYTNAPAGVALAVEDAKKLSRPAAVDDGDAARQARQAATEAHLVARADAFGQGNGLFSRGARDLAAGLRGRTELGRRLASVDLNGDTDGVKGAVRLVHQYFQRNIAQAAMIVLGNEDFDAHSADQARKQPETFAEKVAEIATIFEYLRVTPFDEARGLSLLDVTTVLCCSEFSRTMRQEGKPIDATGTDHNALTNSMLIGGKGIRGGMVVGASDLQAVDEAGAFRDVSAAHQLLDPALKKPMGRPFDVEAMAPLAALPETFDKSQYLSASMVVNTIHELFGTPDAVRRRFAMSEPSVKALRGLLR